MKFDVVTLFPEVFESALSKGIVGQNIHDGQIQLNLIDLREFSETKYKHVDDRPFGGGDGMILMPDPLAKAIRSIEKTEKTKVIYLSPQGRVFNDKLARELASDFDQVVLICGRYGGIDERIIEKYVDEEISIGDFVLSGGEFGALVVIDVVSRLLPGVLGNQESASNDSFSDGLLEAPQFTRPREFEESTVPEILFSGDHAKIKSWRRLLSILRTKFRRPDLLMEAEVDPKEVSSALSIYNSMSDVDRKTCGLPTIDSIGKPNRL